MKSLVVVVVAFVCIQINIVQAEDNSTISYLGVGTISRSYNECIQDELKNVFESFLREDLELSNKGSSHYTSGLLEGGQLQSHSFVGHIGFKRKNTDAPDEIVRYEFRDDVLRISYSGKFTGHSAIRRYSVVNVPEIDFESIREVEGSDQSSYLMANEVSYKQNYQRKESPLWDADTNRTMTDGVSKQVLFNHARFGKCLSTTMTYHSLRESLGEVVSLNQEESTASLTVTDEDRRFLDSSKVSENRVRVMSAKSNAE